MYLIMNIIGRVPSLETWAEIAIRRAALYCSPALKLELPNMDLKILKWPTRNFRAESNRPDIGGGNIGIGEKAFEGGIHHVS